MTQLQNEEQRGPIPGRPAGAEGAFLRVLCITDTYTLHNFPHVVQAAREAKAEAARDPRGCVVITAHCGDIVSPTPLTSIDFGKSMIEGLNTVPIDYACLGNHEFDLTAAVLQKRIHEFQGKWLNANIKDPNFTGSDGELLPAYDIIQVGQRKVAIGGFCTVQPAIYRPGTLRDAVPIVESVMATWEAAAAKGADAMVPLTHQLIHEDCELLHALHKHPHTRGRVPYVLGGHEHEIYEVSEEGGSVLKVGQDAETVGVVDLWWDGEGTLRSRHALVPATAFARDAECAALVAHKEGLLGSMSGVAICTLDRPMSSKNTRKQAEGIAQLLCTKIKRSVPNADLCILQGGAVRGGADYPAGPFTYGDLVNEMPFETEICVVQLPGHVIAESVKHSRSRPDLERATFLHLDDGAEFEDFPGLACLRLNGEPFEAERMYTVAIYRVLVTGMDEVRPLLDHIHRAGVRVPALEEAIPAKQLVMETCMKEEWRRLVAGAAPMGHADLEEAVMRAFTQMDANGDGQIDHAELSAFISRTPRHAADTGEAKEQLLSWLISTLDTNHNGSVSLSELRSFIVH